MYAIVFVMHLLHNLALTYPHNLSRSSNPMCTHNNFYRLHLLLQMNVLTSVLLSVLSTHWDASRYPMIALRILILLDNLACLSEFIHLLGSQNSFVLIPIMLQFLLIIWIVNKIIFLRLQYSLLWVKDLFHRVIMVTIMNCGRIPHHLWFGVFGAHIDWLIVIIEWSIMGLIVNFKSATIPCFLLVI